MKLTWFGGATFRLQIGGYIVVTYPNEAPPAVNRSELESGADRIVEVAHPPPTILDWRPLVATAPINQEGKPSLDLAKLPEAGLAVTATGEAPLILTDADWGSFVDFLAPHPRWGQEAVVVIYSGSSSPDSIAQEAETVLSGLRPKLIAIAGDSDALDLVWGTIASHLDGTSLVSLEPGLALEV